jgi:hypothetical protein
LPKRTIFLTKRAENLVKRIAMSCKHHSTFKLLDALLMGSFTALSDTSNFNPEYMLAKVDVTVEQVYAQQPLANAEG